MENIIQIILKDMNKLEEKIKEIKKNVEKAKKVLKRLKIIITFLFITNLMTLILLWR